MALTFDLELADGMPADRCRSRPSRRSGDPATRSRWGYKTLGVVDVRDGDLDEDPVLVVEDVSVPPSLPSS